MVAMVARSTTGWTSCAAAAAARALLSFLLSLVCGVPDGGAVAVAVSITVDCCGCSAGVLSSTADWLNWAAELGE